MDFGFQALLYLLRALGLYLAVGILIRLVQLGLRDEANVGIKRFFPRIRWALPLLVFGLPFLGHMHQAFFQRLTDWNPYNIDNSAMVGIWKKGSRQVELNSDGTAEFRGRGISESWKKAKFLWNLVEHRDGPLEGTALQVSNTEGVIVAEWPVVIFNEQYRILDKWEEINSLVDLGFSKRTRPQ